MWRIFSFHYYYQRFFLSVVKKNLQENEEIMGDVKKIERIFFRCFVLKTNCLYFFLGNLTDNVRLEHKNLKEKSEKKIEDF